MRVIAGTARSMPLKTVKGMDVRPTTDKTKETLFNVLQTDVPDSRFLDLFSGSGAIGIEALSRGASHAVLVEQDSKAADCILENLQFTKLIDRAELQKCDVLTALHRMEGQKPFDVIFMDPPYDQGLERQVMEYLTRRQMNIQSLLLRLLWRRISPGWRQLASMLTNTKNTKQISMYSFREMMHSVRG